MMESSCPNNHSSEMTSALYESLQTFPKVELHAHLNGCIRESTLFALAAERGVTLTHHFQKSNATENKKEHGLYNVRPRSLQDCFDMFAEIPAAVNDLVALRRIVRETLEDFAFYHTVYLELRSTPKCLLVSHHQTVVATKEDYVNTIQSVMRDFQQEQQERKASLDSRLPMTCRLILSVDRSQSVQQGMDTVHLAKRLYKNPDSLIVGIDFGGNPLRQDFGDFQSVFQEAREAGLLITLHCAELSCGNDNNDTPAETSAAREAAAMLDFRPDRLGHALLLSPTLRQRLHTLQIPVETCPTSNVMTLELARGAQGDLVHGLQQHAALQEWLASNHPLAVSTDDPGVFDTNATKELVLLATAMNLSLQDLAKLIVRSMDGAFCDSTTRETIKEQMKERLDQLLLG